MTTTAKPSQGERRRAREHARQHGLRYTDALRAIRGGATEPQTRYLYIYYRPPRLDGADPGCVACDGTGFNGALYTAAEHQGDVLLCDQMCRSTLKRKPCTASATPT